MHSLCIQCQDLKYIEQLLGSHCNTIMEFKNIYIFKYIYSYIQIQNKCNMISFFIQTH